MWIKREDYIELRAQVAAQSATIEWLRQDWNRLTRENAELKEAHLGIPATQRVPQIERAEPAITALSRRMLAKTDAEPPSMQDLIAGNMSFEDMGDDAAAKSGTEWDPNTGQVRYK